MCLEYDLFYRVSYEQTFTGFELGPSSWLCKHAQLPSKLVQENDIQAEQDGFY